MATSTRPSGQHTFTSLQFASPVSNVWQIAALTSTLVQKVDGVTVNTWGTDGSLVSSGGLTLAKALSVSGNAAVTGTLTVTGATALNASLTLAAALTQTGAGNAVSFAGPLTLTNSLTQTGTGAINLAGAVFATGAVQMAGTLTQTGTGAVSFGGPTVLTNTLSVSGSFSTSLGGALAVTGASTLTGAVTTAGTLTIGGVDGSGRSLMAINPSASSNVFALGQSLGTNTAAVLQYLSGTVGKVSLGMFGAAGLTVDGTGNVVAPAGLAVSGVTSHTGAVTCSSTLAVSGGSTLSGTVACGAALSVATTSTLAGAVTCSSSLAVAGTSTLTGAVTCGNTLTTAGAITCNGTAIYLNGGNPGLVMQGAGGGGSYAGLVMSSYNYGANPAPLQFGASDDGNFGANFVLQQKPSGAITNALVTRLLIPAATGFFGVNNGAPAVQLDVGGAGQFSQVAAGKQVTVKNTSATNDPNGAEVYFDRTAVAATQYASVGVSGTTRNFYVNVGGGTDEINIAPGGAVSVNQPMKLANSASFTGNYPELASRPLATVYNAGTVTYNAKIWVGTATTAAAQATFYPTTTNAAGGAALFTTILSVQAVAVLRTTNGQAVPGTSVYSVSTASVVVNSFVAYSGAAVANGTTVYCTILGV